MLCRIQHLLSAVILAFLGAYVGHSLYLCIDYHSRPQLYALYSAPWYTAIYVNGLLTLLIAGVFFLIRLWVRRLIQKTNA